MLSSVIMPSVPSEPISKFFRSYPVGTTNTDPMSAMSDLSNSSRAL
jgi:hypothetical protein